MAEVLDGVRNRPGPITVIAVPPVRGLAFFADRERQDGIDRWWSHVVPSNATPVFILEHEPGLPRWLPGLDGRAVIGVEEPAQAGAYAALEGVRVAELSLLALALTTLEVCADLAAFRWDAQARLQRSLQPERAFRRARLRPADEVFVTGRPVGPASHPIPNVPHPPELREDLVRQLSDTLQRLRRLRAAP